MEEIIKVLWSASDSRKECRVNLQGEPFPRIIHPYGVCQTSNGKIVVVCKQVGGYTKGGGFEGYRNLILEKVKEVELLEKSFTIALDFDPKNSLYGEWVYFITN
ncbi:hypothetical protein [Ekhidna sp.]